MFLGGGPDWNSLANCGRWCGLRRCHGLSARRNFSVFGSFLAIQRPVRLKPRTPLKPVLNLAKTAVAKTLKDSIQAQDPKSPTTKKPRGRPKSAKAKAPTSTENAGTHEAGALFRLRASTRTKVTGDRNRVHVVSDELCDDIIAYAGSSLEKHKGCDLIDLNPGAGLWSTKLHDFLQPRSHLLLEPAVETYEQLLRPLLERPGVTLLKKNGIIWKDLASVLTPEFLPHQAAYDTTSGAPRRRNDTLLVTANLAYHPKRPWRGFDSVVGMVMHQLLEDIRTSTNFQRYGLVRMLVWTRSDDCANLIPLVSRTRMRTAINGELYCEHIQEICGTRSARSEDPGIWHREIDLDSASAIATAQRMRTADLVMPERRMSADFRRAQQCLDEDTIIVPGSRPPIRKQPMWNELPGEAAFKRASEANSERDDDSADEAAPTPAQRRAIVQLNSRRLSEVRMLKETFELRQELLQVGSLKASGVHTDEDIAERAAKVLEHYRRNARRALDEQWGSYRTNLHFWHQDKPVLHWDRRQFEPMTVDAGEFLPNLACALLDVQPKTPHWTLQPQTMQPRHAADTSSIIIQYLINATGPLTKALDSLWPGASDFIIPRCESLRDPKLGGIDPLLQAPGNFFTPKLLSARQLEDIVELWLAWPFRPEFSELVARTGEDDAAFDQEGEWAHGETKGSSA